MYFTLLALLLSLSLSLSANSDEPPQSDEAVLSMQQPAADLEGTEWEDWEYSIPVTIRHRDARTSGALPVDFTFAVFAGQMEDPSREIRLLLREGGEYREIPFQLWGVALRERDTDGERSRPTITGTVTFFDEAGSDSEARYFLLYGNPSADLPDYPTDLRVSGHAPELVIENARMRVELHPSGQLAAVTPDGADRAIDTDRGILHWNPGVFIPTRYWAHAWDWDPPELVELESGPVFVTLRRSGPLPDFPELHLSVTYRIFSGKPYVESSTRWEVLDDIGVVSLRNDQLIFDPELFDRLAWMDENREVVVGNFDDFEPVNHHGDILRFRPDAGFVAFFNEQSGLGAASIRREASNSGPGGKAPVLFDHSTYIANASSLTYWFRPLVYFHVDWSREKLITIPEGSIYSERNLYLFFRPESGDPLQEVLHYRRAADHVPFIDAGPYRLPPSR